MNVTHAQGDEDGKRLQSYTRCADSPRHSMPHQQQLQASMFDHTQAARTDKERDALPRGLPSSPQSNVLEAEADTFWDQCTLHKELQL
jgi:hypothetical protein